ncbi:MAG: peptide chain release factor N(5)-glutamine methyltransferase [Chthoniobacteraceae bacterium]
MRTVLEVIQATTDFFTRKGVESPRLNIEHLLAHVLGKKRMELYLEFDRPLADTELEPLRLLVRRRADGEPLQHLLGTVEFHGRVFKSDSRALIPRPETELLCEKLLARPAVPTRVLDVGTGSGIIALTLAEAWPKADVTGVDISSDALKLARENATALGLAERVTFLESDLLAAVDDRFDLIVANLPYIAESEMAGLAREVHFDPKVALVAGKSGREIIERLIAECPRVLKGTLALETGCDQGDALAPVLTDHNFHDIEVLADYEGRSRFIFAHHG